MASSLITYNPASGGGNYYDAQHHDMPVAAAQSPKVVAMHVYEPATGWNMAVSTDAGTTWSLKAAVGSPGENIVFPDVAGTGFWFVQLYGAGCTDSGCSTTYSPEACCNCVPFGSCCSPGACGGNPCGSCGGKSAGCTSSGCNGSKTYAITRWTPNGYSATLATQSADCNYGGCTVNQGVGCCASGSLSCSGGSCAYGLNGVATIVGDTLCYSQAGTTQRYTLSGGLTAGSAVSTAALGAWPAPAVLSTGVMVDTTNGMHVGATTNGSALTLSQISGTSSFTETVDAATSWANQNVSVIYTGAALYAFAWLSATSLSVYLRNNLTFGSAQSWTFVLTLTGLPAITDQFCASGSRVAQGQHAFGAYRSTVVHSQGDVVLVNLNTGVAKTIYANTVNTQPPHAITLGQGDGTPLHFIAYNGTNYSQNMYAQLFDDVSQGRKGYHEPFKGGDRGRGLYSSF